MRIAEWICRGRLFFLAMNSYLQPATVSDIRTSVFMIRTSMKNTYHWIFTVITRVVVFVRIASTILKASTATAVNPSSTDLGTNHSTQLTYVSVSLFKIKITFNISYEFYKLCSFYMFN